MGKGCVRFKSLEDLALDVRFAGRELYGGRPRAVASWSREAGAAVLVKTGRPHRCARVRGGAHGQLPARRGRSWAKRDSNGRDPKSSAKKGAKKSAVKEAKPKDVTPSPTPISAFQLSEFQPFPCRPSGDGSGEKLQALLSQREVMLQLPLHSRPQILRWTCACKVPRIFPPGFDQA